MFSSQNPSWSLTNHSISTSILTKWWVIVDFNWQIMLWSRHPNWQLTCWEIILSFYPTSHVSISTSIQITPNVNWWIVFWSPCPHWKLTDSFKSFFDTDPYWPLTDGLKFEVTIHISFATSLLANDRLLQVLKLFLRMTWHNFQFHIISAHTHTTSIQ